MTGSKCWWVYSDDQGAPWAVNLDKSNYLNSNIGFRRVNSGEQIDIISSAIKMRYALTYQANVLNRKRKFYVGTLARYQYLNDNRIIVAPLYEGSDNVNWIITWLGGEKQRLAYSNETGLNDGTN